MEGNHSEHENSCFYLGDPSFHKAHERFTINLVTAIINIVTVPVGVIANLLIVTAIFGCPRLQTPSNLLIASLALSDLFVSLTVHLGYITYRLLENQLRLVPCFVRIMYHLAFFSCFGVSFMTLSAVSYERFVAVRLQVRYNDFFSSTRVVKYVLIIWTLNILLTALKWTSIESAVENIHLMVWSVCFLVSVATQIGVLYVVRIQREQVQPQLQGAENRQRQREAKLAKNISILVGVYLILNFPVLFTLIYDQLLRLNLQTNNHYSWTETLAFFNSCTNSLICYWKNVEVRQKVKNILKKLVCQ